MIRFLDAEVFTARKDEDISAILRYVFLDKENPYVIFVIVDEKGNYDGIITYDSFLRAKDSENEEGYILHEKLVITPDDENIWQELKKMIRGSEISDALIPVLDVEGNLLYFAYDTPCVEQMQSILTDFENMEIGTLRSFFAGVYPQVRGVRIHDLNEWGYRFYKIMARSGHYIEILGEKWGVLFPHIGKREEMGVAGGKQIIDIHAEATESGWPKSPAVQWVSIRSVNGYWHQILYTLGYDFYEWTEKQFLGNCGGIRFLKVLVPRKDELSFVLPWEEQCVTNIWDAFQNGNSEAVACCQKIYGREITKEEWDERFGRKKSGTRQIAGVNVQTICFGKESSRKLYVIGPCIVEGTTVCDDEETFLYCLYQELKDRGMEYYVIGLVVGQGFQMELYRKVLDSLTIWQDDMILSVRGNQEHYIHEDMVLGVPEAQEHYTHEEGRKLVLTELYNSRKESWFYDMPIHTNYAANQAIAKAVAKEVAAYTGDTGKIQGGGIHIGKRMFSLEESEMVEQYIRQVQINGQHKGGEKVGAIVMNCNPMTKGHLHLIETARKSVDYLYVFVVEEDRSDIPFAIRYAMVRAQTKEMDDVCVSSSGKFILSYETLPLYFEKAEKQEAVLDATGDLQIFCQYIAPRLGITKRFVGEEPTDNVTRQYNEEMKRTLPYYGMELIEIPRVKQGGQYVSASAVRRLAEKGDREAVQRLVPKEAFQVLAEKYADYLRGEKS